MKRKPKKIQPSKIAINHLDNSFVESVQVDAAMNYLARNGKISTIPTIGNKKLADINKQLFAKIKMPLPPKHLRGEEIKKVGRLTKIVECVKMMWKNK